MKFILSALLVFVTMLGCTAAERILMTRLGPSSRASLFRTLTEAASRS